MRTAASLLTALLLFSTVAIPQAQAQDRHLELKVEPVAYVLGGAGGHVGVQSGAWSYTLEVFGLDVPASLHGQDAFEVSPLGAEIHAERFFGGSTSGFYAGPEVGVTRLEITHSASGKTERPVRVSVGLRGGYRWYPGLGDLFLSPVVGLGYTLNGEPVDIENDTFDGGSVTPWGTVGIGWSF